MLRRLGGCLVVGALCLLLGGAARADDLRSARVSDAQGNLAVRGASDSDVSYVGQNAVVRPGDTLWTDDKSRAELELDRGVWLRFAEDTKLDVIDLPPSAAQFRLWTGSVYVDASDRIDTFVKVDTPSGDVEVERNSVVRIDLNESSAVRVSVYHGRARVLPAGGDSLRLGSNQRMYLDSSRGSEEPQSLDRGDQDSFDEYNRQRTDYYINRPLPQHLSEDIVGARDLDNYGSWVDVEGDYYWRPRVSADWRPYSSGYWSYVPACGYTWIDYDPWGYTCSHYGRWIYRPVYGWCWHPGYVWAPAYVSWCDYGGYYGWCPLDPFDRPCSGFGVSFVSGGFGISLGCWSFCPRDDFFFGRFHAFYGHRPYWGWNTVRAHGHFGGGFGVGFAVVRDPYRHFGVPRETVRGLTVRNGVPARSRVLHVENSIPQRRLQQIGRRFGVQPTRDRAFASRPSQVERLQTSRNVATSGFIARGNEAANRPHVSTPVPSTTGRAASGLGRGPGRASGFGRGSANEGSAFGRGGSTSAPRTGGAFGSTSRSRGAATSGRGSGSERGNAFERGNSTGRSNGFERGNALGRGSASERGNAFERGNRSGSPAFERGRGTSASDRDAGFRRGGSAGGATSGPGRGFGAQETRSGSFQRGGASEFGRSQGAERGSRSESSFGRERGSSSFGLSPSTDRDSGFRHGGSSGGSQPSFGPRGGGSFQESPRSSGRSFNESSRSSGRNFNRGGGSSFEDSPRSQGRTFNRDGGSYQDFPRGSAPRERGSFQDYRGPSGRSFDRAPSYDRGSRSDRGGSGGGFNRGGGFDRAPRGGGGVDRAPSGGYQRNGGGGGSNRSDNRGGSGNRDNGNGNGNGNRDRDRGGRGR